MYSSVEEILECVFESRDHLNYRLKDEESLKVFKEVGNNVIQEIDRDINFENRDEEKTASDKDFKGQNIDEVLIYIHVQ